MSDFKPTCKTPPINSRRSSPEPQWEQASKLDYAHAHAHASFLKRAANRHRDLINHLQQTPALPLPAVQACDLRSLGL